MPLSEEEMRLLQQMERALAAEDPKFASALRSPSALGREPSSLPPLSGSWQAWRP
ncbi:MAG: DUF3040 domain-containing protein [Marmoricola sp.]